MALRSIAAGLLVSALALAGCVSETSSGEPPQSIGAEVEQSGDIAADGEAPYVPDVGERLWPGNTVPGLLRFVTHGEEEGWTAPTEADDLVVLTGSWVLVSGSGFAPFAAVDLELVSGDLEELEALGEAASLDDFSFADLAPVTADDRGVIEARWQVPDTESAAVYIFRAAGPGRWGDPLESVTDGFLVGQPGDAPAQNAPRDLEWDASRRDMGYSAEDSAAAAGHRRLALGSHHTCVLQRDSTVRCGGYAPGAEAEDPAGEFMAISAGGFNSCGIRLDGTLACWGANSELSDRVPEGVFVSVDVHATHACAVRSDGGLVCWGSYCQWGSVGEVPMCEDASETERAGRGPIPDGRYKSVSIGSEVACAITEHDEISCWSWHAGFEPDTPPQGAYRSVDVGGLDACAVPIEGNLECWYWGSYNKSMFDEPPAGRFVALSVDDTLCALHRSGGISCWDGDDSYEDLRIFDAPAGTFVDVATTHTRACGLTVGEQVVCWGEYEGQTVDAPGGTFNSLSVGYDHSCGLRHDGTVECWGSNLLWQSDNPTGSFASVEALKYRTCAVRTSGQEVCWGTRGVGGIPVSVPVGGGSVPQEASYCNVQDRLVVCVDSQYEGRYEGAHSLPEDLPADLTTVTAGWGFACGTRVNGERLCWGQSGHYIDAPQGSFDYLRAGTWFACGLRPSGEVECWGRYPTSPSFVQWVQQRHPWPEGGAVAAP